MKLATATIDVTGHGPIRIFQDDELEKIGQAMRAFYGKDPDQATADACLAALAEARIMAIGLRYVLDGRSGVGFSAEEGLQFGAFGTLSVRSGGDA